MNALPNGINAEYLTEALRRSGALGAGRVREVRVQASRNTRRSEIARLRIDYDGDCDHAPRLLIFKTSLPGRPRPTWNASHEVEFYAKVAAALPTDLLPRCFDAVSHSGGTSWHLLLENLAGTHHTATMWPLPPSVNESARIVEARARFHAMWWDHARLGVSVGRWPSPEDINGVLKQFGGRFARFVDRTGDLLTPERRTLYERLIDALQRLSARRHSHRNMTVIQGDGHFWNCFLSKNGDGVKFTDWDCWRIDAGTDDLAYMIAMHWYPDRRRSFERKLLDRYHETLVAHGVSGYDRRTLDDDYRLSVLRQIMTPVWQASVDLPPGVWWNNYERIMMAVDDLGCRELLP